ncbi:hypothetical protein [Streptomyces sp. S1]|uniref:hypothetical protein n=1 Tax=Streptomyces sp. S1 TaxID=718288 RepID=UPI003D70DB70
MAQTRNLHLRPMMTLPLPGDADGVLEFEYRRAVRRDGMPNIEERQILHLIRACKGARSTMPWWRCSRRDPCTFCTEAAEI